MRDSLDFIWHMLKAMPFLIIWSVFAAALYTGAVYLGHMLAELIS
jgi:hypothetical protein